MVRPAPERAPEIMTERKKQKPIKTFLTPQRISEIKSEIRQKEAMLNADRREVELADGVGYYSHIKSHLSSPTEIKQDISKLKRTLHDGTPHKYTGEQANRAYAYAKKLETWIRANIPDNRTHGTPYPEKKNTAHADTSFEAAVRREMHWMKHSGRVISMYRYLMRRIDPDNPDLGNIERFRR